MGIYEDVFNKVSEIEEKEGLHIKKIYKVNKKIFKCDIQPITEQSIRYIWGEEIKSKLQMYCNENLLIYDILVNDNKTYKIEAKKDWKEYKIYALLETDLEVFYES